MLAPTAPSGHGSHASLDKSRSPSSRRSEALSDRGEISRSADVMPHPFMLDGALHSDGEIDEYGSQDGSMTPASDVTLRGGALSALFDRIKRLEAARDEALIRAEVAELRSSALESSQTDLLSKVTKVRAERDALRLSNAQLVVQCEARAREAAALRSAMSTQSAAVAVAAASVEHSHLAGEGGASRSPSATVDHSPPSSHASAPSEAVVDQLAAQFHALVAAGCPSAAKDHSRPGVPSLIDGVTDEGSVADGLYVPLTAPPLASNVERAVAVARVEISSLRQQLVDSEALRVAAQLAAEESKANCREALSAEGAVHEDVVMLSERLSVEQQRVNALVGVLRGVGETLASLSRHLVRRGGDSSPAEFEQEGLAHAGGGGAADDLVAFGRAVAASGGASVPYLSSSIDDTAGLPAAALALIGTLPASVDDVVEGGVDDVLHEDVGVLDRAAVAAALRAAGIDGWVSHDSAGVVGKAFATWDADHDLGGPRREAGGVSGPSPVSTARRLHARSGSSEGSQRALRESPLVDGRVSKRGFGALRSVLDAIRGVYAVRGAVAAQSSHAVGATRELGEAVARLLATRLADQPTDHPSLPALRGVASLKAARGESGSGGGARDVIPKFVVDIPKQLPLPPDALHAATDVILARPALIHALSDSARQLDALVEITRAATKVVRAARREGAAAARVQRPASVSASTGKAPSSRQQSSLAASGVGGPRVQNVRDLLQWSEESIARAAAGLPATARDSAISRGAASPSLSRSRSRKRRKRAAGVSSRGGIGRSGSPVRGDVRSPLSSADLRGVQFDSTRPPTREGAAHLAAAASHVEALSGGAVGLQDSLASSVAMCPRCELSQPGRRIAEAIEATVRTATGARSVLLELLANHFTPAELRWGGLHQVADKELHKRRLARKERGVDVVLRDVGSIASASRLDASSYSRRLAAQERPSADALAASSIAGADAVAVMRSQTRSARSRASNIGPRELQAVAARAAQEALNAFEAKHNSGFGSSSTDALSAEHGRRSTHRGRDVDGSSADLSAAGGKVRSQIAGPGGKMAKRSGAAGHVAVQVTSSPVEVPPFAIAAAPVAASGAQKGGSFVEWLGSGVFRCLASRTANSQPPCQLAVLLCVSSPSSPSQASHIAAAVVDYVKHLRELGSAVSVDVVLCSRDPRLLVGLQDSDEVLSALSDVDISPKNVVFGAAADLVHPQYSDAALAGVAAKAGVAQQGSAEKKGARMPVTKAVSSVLSVLPHRLALIVVDAVPVDPTSAERAVADFVRRGVVVTVATSSSSAEVSTFAAQLVRAGERAAAKEARTAGFDVQDDPVAAAVYAQSLGGGVDLLSPHAAEGEDGTCAAFVRTPPSEDIVKRARAAAAARAEAELSTALALVASSDRSLPDKVPNAGNVESSRVGGGKAYDVEPLVKGAASILSGSRRASVIKVVRSQAGPRAGSRRGSVTVTAVSGVVEGPVEVGESPSPAPDSLSTNQVVPVAPEGDAAGADASLNETPPPPSGPVSVHRGGASDEGDLAGAAEGVLACVETATSPVQEPPSGDVLKSEGDAVKGRQRPADVDSLSDAQAAEGGGAGSAVEGGQTPPAVPAVVDGGTVLSNSDASPVEAAGGGAAGRDGVAVCVDDGPSPVVEEV